MAKFTAYDPRPQARMPYGTFMGPLDVGKTTLIAQAFPDFAYLATSASALAGPIGYLEPRGYEVPKAIILLDDERNELGEAKHDWFSTMTQMFTRWRKLARRHPKFGPFIPKGAKLVPGGYELPVPIRGIVISEATSLMRWMDRDAKIAYGRSFDTNARVVGLLGMFNAWNLATGLGLILDAHTKPAEWKEGVDEDKCMVPEGPGWPFREMRSAGVQDMDFCWKVENMGDADDRQILLTTRAANCDELLCRTRAPKNDPENPFVLNRTQINLTEEKTDIRKVMREAGMFLPQSAAEKAEETQEKTPTLLDVPKEEIGDDDSLGL